MEAQKVTDPILENQLLDLEYLILSKRWPRGEIKEIQDPFQYRKVLSVERMNEILKLAISRQGILSFEGDENELIVLLNGEKI